MHKIPRFSMGFAGIAFIAAGMLLSCGGTSFSGEGQAAFTVEELCRRALERSDAVMLAEEDVKAARRMVEAARAGYFPRLAVQSNYSQSILREQNISSSRLNTDLLFNWQILQAGGTRARVRQAEAQLGLAGLKREEAERSAVSEVTKLYYSYLMAGADRKIGELSFNQAKRRNELSHLLFDMGKTDRIELLKAKSELDREQVALLRLKKEEDSVLADIRKFCGMSAGQEPERTEQINVQKKRPSLSECFETALNRHPDVLGGQVAVEVADMARRHAKWRRFPDFAMFTSSAMDVEKLDQEPDLRVGVVASYPIFDAGQTKMLIEAIESEYDKAVLRMAQTKEEVRGEVEKAYLRVMEAETAFELIELSSRIAGDDSEEARIQYASGRISKYELDETEVMLARSKAELFKSRVGLLLAQQALARSAGALDLSEIPVGGE